MVSRAGERPAKSSLTSPVCTLPEGFRLGRAFARLASTCSNNAYRALPDGPEIVRVRLWCLRR